MLNSCQRAGTAGPSFTATLLEESNMDGTLSAEHAEDIKGAAGIIYAGGYPLRPCRAFQHIYTPIPAGTDTASVHSERFEGGIY